jgi:histidinol-phosphate aminotransferase
VNKVSIKDMLRPEIKAISPYQGEKDNFEVKINLSGNESPFDLPDKIKKEFNQEFEKRDINRYPEIYSEELHQTLADYLSSELKKEVSVDEVAAGNGSDELLDMLIRTFVEPGDVVLSQAPTFSMYEYFTRLSGGVYKEIPLNDQFRFEVIKEKIDEFKPKIIFLCSPNNPTGEVIDKSLILKLADYFAGPILVDEAYADFSSEDLMQEVSDYQNLAVTRTFSKAFGLAGIRLGYLYGSKILVEELKKVLKPYNLNSLTDIIGCLVLKNNDIIKERIELIKSERERVFEQLADYEDWDVFPTQANFIYLEGAKTHLFKSMLNTEGIKIRSYNSEPPAIRITIGSQEENDAVLDVFQNFKQQN